MRGLRGGWGESRDLSHLRRWLGQRIPLVED